MTKITVLVGKCIYCGSTQSLTKEHIVPKGLGGEQILLEACCPDCQRILTRIERYVLRELLIMPRATLGLPTYHKKARPKSFLLRVAKNGIEKTIDVPSDKCPVIIPIPYFKMPAYVANYPYEKGIMVTGMGTNISGLRRFQKEYDFDTLTGTLQFKTDFARLLAKIAYGMAVAEFGLDSIEEAYVLPAILGKRDDIGYWVGCGDEDIPPRQLPVENYAYRVDIINGVIGDKEEIRALVRLFPAYTGTLQYLVVIGRLRKGWRKQKEMPK